jgi:hypothetical protein
MEWAYLAAMNLYVIVDVPKERVIGPFRTYAIAEEYRDTHIPYAGIVLITNPNP